MALWLNNEVMMKTLANSTMYTDENTISNVNKMALWLNNEVMMKTLANSTMYIVYVFSARHPMPQLYHQQYTC